MANNQTKTNADQFSNIIRDAMNNEERNGTRQRDLVLFMFNDMAGTFGLTTIPKFFSVKGKERADLFAETLSDMSAEYSENAATIARLSTQMKDNNTSKLDKEKYGLQVEALKGKLRAANILFERALQAVYFLHSAKADGVNPAKVTKGSLSFLRDDPEHKGTGKPERVRTTESINALTRFGKTAVDKKVGKAPPKARAAGDGGANVGMKGVQMAANVVESFMSLSDQHYNGDAPFMPLDDYKDEDEAALSKVFVRLFRAKFADTKGIVNPEDVVEWIKGEKLDKPVAKAPKPSAEPPVSEQVKIKPTVKPANNKAAAKKAA